MLLTPIVIIFLACLLLGAVVGFLAGLLGIGGGVLIVPILSAILYKLNIVAEQPAFLIAVATSLSSIIFTSFSSALSHHRYHKIDWSLAGWATVGVAFGAAVSSLFSGMIKIEVLKTLFAITMTFVAVRMAFSAGITSGHPQPRVNKLVLVPLTSLIGGLSSLIGIGGGALIIPLMGFFKVDIRKSIGIAAVAATCVASVASVGYIWVGRTHYQLADGFLGYIYLPALIGLIITSSAFAPLGAKIAQRVPVKMLKRLFAAFIALIVIKMVFL
ncbi:MAG: putative membrane protein YfcA [Alteromonadaceae bacterium]|jgi:uncharacterized membrane protein YfcA